MKSSDNRLAPWPVLAGAARRGRLGQALLLVGDEKGCQSAAAAVARWRLCEGDGGEACGCRSCRVRLDAHPDMLHVCPEPKTIRLDAVQGALARSQSAPLWSAMTVLWFDPVTVMTPEAETSLLKSLEEPEATMQYLLTAERPDQVLPTVVSRCQIVNIAQTPRTVQPFRVEHLADHGRDLQEDLTAAAEAVRTRYLEHPDPRLLTLFDVLVEAYGGVGHNLNQELTRETVALWWQRIIRQRATAGWDGLGAGR